MKSKLKYMEGSRRVNPFTWKRVQGLEEVGRDGKGDKKGIKRCPVGTAAPHKEHKGYRLQMWTEAGG